MGGNAQSEPSIKVAAAIMDADLARLADAIAEVEAAGADLLHVDIMDGHFVPSFVGGPRVVAAIKRHATVPVDVHLMLTNPEEAVPWFLDAGADIVLFHPETARDLEAVVGKVKDAGRGVGLALKPLQPPDPVRAVAQELDCVMAMTVEPGFSGQGFMESGCHKIPALRRMCRPGIDVYVDGGISEETAATAVSYGANVLAAASAIFCSELPPGPALKRLKQAARHAAHT